MIEPRPEISFSEFVAWETTQTELHELINGAIVPFRAGSADHAIITGNVFAKLHATIEPPCLVFQAPPSFRPQIAAARMATAAT